MHALFGNGSVPPLERVLDSVSTSIQVCLSDRSLWHQMMASGHYNLVGQLQLDLHVMHDYLIELNGALSQMRPDALSERLDVIVEFMQPLVRLSSSHTSGPQAFERLTTVAAWLRLRACERPTDTEPTPVPPEGVPMELPPAALIPLVVATPRPTRTDEEARRLAMLHENLAFNEMEAIAEAAYEADRVRPSSQPRDLVDDDYVDYRIDYYHGGESEISSGGWSRGTWRERRVRSAWLARDPATLSTLQDDAATLEAEQMTIDDAYQMAGEDWDEEADLPWWDNQEFDN